MISVDIAENMYSQAGILVWGAPVLVILAICLLHARHAVWPSRRTAPKIASAISHNIQPHTTQLLPCAISHCRLFPKQHRFRYPYLSVGVPVRSPSSNWLLSVDNQPWWKRGWFHVSPKDHLHRGRDGATLSENIDAYLKLQGLEPSDYPFIYLLTSPRFLDYAFKPASFWFLYTEDRTLTHIVAEVNNTFGERRMYLFNAPPYGSAFKGTMRKDFHVSPFSSRKGSYVLSSSDPMGQDRISVTVTLRSSKEHTKLIAKWWSIGPAIDPATISLLGSLWLIMSWGPTVLTTVLKIVFEAVVLAQVRRLQIWYRPEPQETAIPRQPNANEAYLAAVFARYLAFFWAQAKEKYLVSIVPRHEENNKGLPGLSPYGLLHMRIAKVHDKSQSLSLTVHSPQFYRQINTCRKFSELLEISLLDPQVENRTAWSTDAVALVSSAKEVEHAIEGLENAGPGNGSWFNPSRAIWKLYRRLLCAHRLPGVYPYPALPAARSGISLRKSRPGSDESVSEPFLDSFIAQELGMGSQLRYMAVALQLRWRTWLVGIIGGE